MRQTTNRAYVAAKAGQTLNLRDQIQLDSATNIISGDDGGFVVQTTVPIQNLPNRFSSAARVRSSSPSSGEVSRSDAVVKGRPAERQGTIGVVLVPKASPAHYRITLNGRVVRRRPKRIDVYGSTQQRTVVSGTIRPSETDHRLLLQNATLSPVAEAEGPILTEVKKNLSSVEGATDMDWLHDGSPSRPSLKPAQAEVNESAPFASVLMSDESAIRNMRTTPALMLLANKKASMQLPVEMTVSRANEAAALEAVRSVGGTSQVKSMGGSTYTFTVPAGRAEMLADVKGAVFALDASKLPDDQSVAGPVEQARMMAQATTNANDQMQNADESQEVAASRIIPGVSDWTVGLTAVGLGGIALWYSSGSSR